MRTLVAIFLFASLFIGSLFAESRTFTNLGSDSLADISRADILQYSSWLVIHLLMMTLCQ